MKESRMKYTNADKPQGNTSHSMITTDTASIVLQAQINTNELLIDFIVF